MRNLITVIIIFISLNSFGQKELQKVKLNDKYTWQNYTLNETDEYYFKINQIKNTDFKYYFRYRKTGQIVDVYSNDGLNFSGILLNEIREYKNKKDKFGYKPSADRYYYETIDLNKDTSSLIGRFIIDNQFYKLPTDSLITNWKHSFTDCVGINFIFKVNNEFNYSDYYCLIGQNDTTEFITEIKNLNDTIIKSFNLENKYNKFKTNLEGGKTYSSNGMWLMYIFSKKENKAWRKSQSQREYLKTISDTITNYLETELNKLIVDKNQVDCYDDYYVYFTKKGKFKKIKVNKSVFEKYDDKDYSACNKKLKNALKNVHIDFIDPKYEFVRKIDFYNNKIRVYDQTAY